MRSLTLIAKFSRPFVIGNNVFAVWLGQLMSLSIWPLLILIGSFLGLALRQQDVVMVLLTIQTSIDAAATKTLQSIVNRTDEARAIASRDQMDTIAKLLMQVKSQNDAALARDRTAAKRDRMILSGFEAQGELLTYLLSEGKSAHATTRKTRTRTRRKRKADGRANRKKS